MTRYQSLEDVVSEYTTVKELTEKSIWAECDVLVQAHDDGFTIDEIKRQIAHAARCSSRLVYDRYKMGRVFPPERRNPMLTPEIHRICASQVDLRETSPDFGPAYDWLAIAAENEYSTRKLSKAIKNAGGNPDADKPVYLLDDVEAWISDVRAAAYGAYITLYVEPCQPIKPEQTVHVTIVKAPPVEREPEALPL